MAFDDTKCTPSYTRFRFQFNLIHLPLKMRRLRTHTQTDCLHTSIGNGNTKQTVSLFRILHGTVWSLKAVCIEYHLPLSSYICLLRRMKWINDFSFISLLFFLSSQVIPRMCNRSFCSIQFACHIIRCTAFNIFCAGDFIYFMALREFEHDGNKKLFWFYLILSCSHGCEN